MRRIVILTALCALAWSGVWAGSGGRRTVSVPIDFVPFDTSLATGGDVATKINDSLFFASPVFACDDPWTNITARFVVDIKDTTVGFSRDSVTIRLQTRDDNDTVFFWKTIGTTTKYPLAAWDSTGLQAARRFQEVNPDSIRNTRSNGGFLAGVPVSGAIATVKIGGFGGPYRGIPSAGINVSDADSIATMGTLFRFEVLHNNPADSTRAFAVSRSSSVIDIMASLKAIVTFHLR